jgi:pimeloyl-ACP methyl ester carboxylesterase
MDNLWRPAGRAFCQGDSERALRLSIDYFVGTGTWDQLPEEVKDGLRANQRDWQALTTSTDAFPHLSRTAVTHLPVPVLMLTGDQTLRIHQLVNDELERLVRNGVRVRFPDATHEIWEQYPDQARAATLAFLADQ